MTSRVRHTRWDEGLALSGKVFHYGTPCVFYAQDRSIIMAIREGGS